MPVCFRSTGANGWFCLRTPIADANTFVCFLSPEIWRIEGCRGSELSAQAGGRGVGLQIGLGQNVSIAVTVQVVPQQRDCGHQW